jgi:uncharacterized protein YbjT (DUF2867 family)
MSTLIIGATGNVGGEIVSQLAAKGGRIRSMLRNPDAASLPPQVEVVRGDLTVPESLDGCLDDVESVFLVWTAPPATIPAVLERIARRARRIVFLSGPNKTPHPLFQGSLPNAIAALHTQVEQLIESSGLQWTFLRPGMFASNARFWWAEQIRAGNVVRWPYAAVPTAPIHPRDIAAVAVRALCEDGHAGAEYVMTGPQSLSQSEQVATIGRAIGRSLRMEEISPDQARQELLTVPLFVINMLLNCWGPAAGQPALVTSTVAEVTGSAARTFFDWATDHVAEFRA